MRNTKCEGKKSSTVLPNNCFKLAKKGDSQREKIHKRAKGRESE